jgi:hypothetical protein
MSRLLPDRGDAHRVRHLAPAAARAAGRTRAVLLTALATSTACYQYLPNQSSDLRVGEEVRLHLTGTGSVALQPLVGANVEAIDGRVVSRADSAYGVSVGGTTKREGGTAVWTGEQLQIPAGAIARVDRRVLSTRKTLLLSVAAVAGAALIAAIIASVSGGGSSGPDTGTTPP